MVRRSHILAAAVACAALAAPAAGRAQSILSQMQDEVAAIVSRSRPAIVAIEDERIFDGPRGRQGEPGGSGHESGPRENERPHGPDRFGGKPMGGPPKVGSGFSIGDGFIVTTADVLSGMKSPMILTDDGRRIHATVTGVDQEMNVGVLKLSSKTPLPGLKLGDSGQVYPGHFAISIGNQYGHLNSVALTLVAGLRDDGFPAGEHFYPGIIQIAGTVGVGTSGAPILNARGEVIGMITGIPFGDWTTSPFPGAPRGGRGGPQPGRPGVVNTAAPPAAGKADLPPAPPSAATQPGDTRFVFLRPPVTSAGFALPIDDMKPVLAALRQGKMVHCWLGVDMGEERKTVESDGAVTTKRTVFVTKVYPGSPAAAAGLQQGDVLQAVNGRPITRLFVIRAALMRAQPGDGMELRVDRKGAVQTINARLAPHPEVQPGPRAH